MKQGIRHLISANAKAGHKMVAWLIDPDSFDPESIFPLSEATDIDLIFVGGSLLSKGDLKTTVAIIKQKYPIPVVLFPGSIQQISSSADAILNLSLISGRNPEFLIGQHVLAAPMLKASGLEILPTGYILVDSGRQTTASYISGTTPVPHDKSDIAICTAMAGEMLGLQLIYLDGGSGAQKTISEQMISGVKKNISVPLIVGGGIREVSDAVKICKAGADVIVIGNAAQENPELIRLISKAVHSIPLLQ